MVSSSKLTEAEKRHHWRLRWLSGLQAFADDSTQRAKWLDPEEANPHFSFIECMCSYFDDADLADGAAYDRRIASGYLSVSEANAVAEFHRLADGYVAPGNDGYDNRAVLNDPAWAEIIEAAKQAQDNLLHMLSDSHEVAALTKPTVWRNRKGILEGKFPEPD